MNFKSSLRIRQLDEVQSFFREFRERPQNGWIKSIREALGIQGNQLAKKLGVAPPTLLKLEISEINKTISLKSLEKAAQAMGCKLVYAFVPPETFERILRLQAMKVATQLVEELQHTMALEDQKISDKEKNLKIQQIADELLRTMDKQLWSRF